MNRLWLRMAAFVVAACFVSEEAVAAPVSTSFTYQGELRASGAPVNGSRNLTFSLWTSQVGGAQVGATLTKPSYPISQGLLTVDLDFGSAFTGDERWLAITVDGTPLTPRLPLTAAPYAMSLRPGASIIGARTSPVVEVVNSSSGVALEATSNGTAGVLGTTLNPNGSGVEGNASGSNAAGVFGVNSNGPGVWGRGTAGGAGVFGQSTGYAVYGASSGGFGVYGTSSNGGVVGVGYVGVQGTANGTADSQGVRGEANGASTYAGVMNGRFLVAGNTTIIGTLAKSAGTFRIDHPLDPANRYLQHSFVESPDMKNIYDGVVMLDARGEALVTMPDWFEALNGDDASDYRYQLTTIGGYAPVYVSREISGNQFRIAGGRRGLKVSWQVTGIRHDGYAKLHRTPVETDKTDEERGRYLTPEAFGADESLAIGAPREKVPR